MKPNDLLKATPSTVRKNARYVYIEKARRFNLKNGGTRIHFTVTSKSRRNVTHKVVVESTKSTTLHNSDIKIYCSCEFFTYYGCSDVLPHYNAGFRHKATGNMPLLRNPTFVPFVCIHAVRVLNKLIRDRK